MGWEEFHLWRSGSLLALNTFGGMLLVVLALPAILDYISAAAMAAAAPAPGSGDKGEADGQATTGSADDGGQQAGTTGPGRSSGDKAATHKPEQAGAASSSRSSSSSSSSSSMVQPLLVAGLVRAATTFCATLSAAVQRRHLYAWALFAPKFAFEACFLMLTDLALLLVAAVH